MLKVMIKVFVGNKSLLRRIFIRFTAVTFCEEKFSHISSSLIPSRSLHLITPFEKLREECGVTLTGMLQKVFDFRRQLECFSLVHSTKSPILIFFDRFWLTSQTNNCLLDSKRRQFSQGPIFSGTNNEKPWPIG